MFLFFLFFYVFIIDIDALLFVSNSEISKRDYDLLYIAGNKFDLTYTNMYLFFIYCKYYIIRNTLKKRYCYLLLLLCLFVSVYSKCSTSIIACLFLFCFFFFKFGKMRIVYSPVFYIIVSITCTFALLVFSTIILQMEAVKSILHMLGESEDLTSRLIIWERIVVLFDQRPLLGFGIGNVGGVVGNLSNAFDTQNGVLDLYIQFGVIGVVLYFSMLIHFLMKSKHNTSSVPFVAYLYMILLISMVEIPLTLSTLIIASFSIIPNRKYYIIINNEKFTYHRRRAIWLSY